MKQFDANGLINSKTPTYKKRVDGGGGLCVSAFYEIH